MSRQVAQQVEQILDEQVDRTVRVIVHMGEPAGRAGGLALSGVGGDGDEPRRHPAQSAREVLPGPVRSARRAAIAGGAEAGGVPCVRPSGPKLAAVEPETEPLMAGIDPAGQIAQLRQSSQETLAPLRECEPVRRNAGTRPGTVTEFWVARSAFLELDRDDLPRLVAEVPGIDAVYADEPVYLPPVSQTRDLPAAVVEDSAASWGLIRTGALATWGAYRARGAGVTVGVLDTGVDATHPDLAGKVSRWAEFDREGQPVAGSEPHDSGDHGTHVCGTIAGGDASGQWIGMAPEATLAVGLVLNGRRGTTAQILAGINWAVDMEVDVLNLSLGGVVFGAEAPAVYSDAFVTCLRAGIPVVTSIGNEGTQTGATTGSEFFALAAGATDHRDVPAGFSGGRTQFVAQSPYIREEFLPLIYLKPDVSAPGMAVTSAAPGGSWAAKDGTSMAAPHVAGGIALLLSAVPEIRSGLTGARRALFLQNQIAGSVDELGESGHDVRFGLGRLNVLRAIALAKQNV